MAPIIKQFARSTSDFVIKRCDSEHAAGKMSAVEYERAIKINTLIDKYKAEYEGKSVEIFRCDARNREFIKIQDLVVLQTQMWKIIGPMHLTNPYDGTISIHRFMSGGAVNEARLDVIRRYCADHRDVEEDFQPDEDFSERLGITCGNLATMAGNAEKTEIAEKSKITEIESELAQSTMRQSQPSVVINAGNIVFPTNLSPISASPGPSNPRKKRKVEILEELAEGMKSMTENFNRLLDEVKVESQNLDESFDVIDQ